MNLMYVAREGRMSPVSARHRRGSPHAVDLSDL